MSLSLSLSHSWIWDGGQVPPRTLRLINHPRFNICPVPKSCPPPLPHPLWRWVLGFIPLSASLHTPPLTPPSGWQNVYCPILKWRRDPLFPSLTKAVWSQDGGCQPRCLGLGRVASSPPYTFLSPSGSSIPCSYSFFLLLILPSHVGVTHSARPPPFSKWWTLSLT